MKTDMIENEKSVNKIKVKDKYIQWFKDHHTIHGDIKPVRIDNKDVVYILRKCNNNNNMT